MNKRLLISLVLLAAVGLGVSLAWRLGGPATPPSPAVATVNGTAITEKALGIRLASLLPMASYHGNVPPEKLASLRRAALDELILEELVWQDAGEQGLSATPAAVEAELEKVRRRFASDDEFQAALREDGTTLGEYREFVARRVVVRQEREQRSALHEPTDAEIASYYEANAGQFMRPEQVHLLEILIKVDPSGTEADERDAKARADAALARLQKGKSFAAVAREVSEDGFAANGGDLGWVHQGRLDRDLEDAAFATPVGQLGQARSISGFHVYTVVEREPARQLTLEEARPLIVDRVQRTRRDATRKAWEDGLRGPARIEILDPVLRAATPAELPRFGQTPPLGPGAAGPSQ
jgi:peptidyl-prolyl cis-trans isomerase C